MGKPTTSLLLSSPLAVEIEASQNLRGAAAGVPTGLEAVFPATADAVSERLNKNREARFIN
jgi:hypothetical protein